LAYWKRGHGFFLGADDYGFSFNAARIVELWKETGQIPKEGTLEWMPYAGELNYTYFLSFIYFFIENNPLIPLFINSVAGSFTVFFIYSIAKQIFGYKVARLSAIFSAFWPSLFFWSTQNLKEPITIFLISVSIWSIIRMKNKFQFTYMITCLPSLFLLYKIRSSIFYFLLLSVFISFLPSLLSRLSRTFLMKILLLIIFLFLFGKNLKELLINKLGLGIHLRGDNSSSIFNMLTTVRYNKTISADSAFLANFKITNVFTFFQFLPLGLLYVLFSPFPWQITKPAQILAGIEMVLWYLLVPFTVKGLKFTLQDKVKSKQSLSIVIFIFIFIFILAVSEGNVGTLFRHRTLIWPFCLIFTAAGINIILENKAPKSKDQTQNFLKDE
jgi:hypothetical protein